MYRILAIGRKITILGLLMTLSLASNAYADNAYHLGDGKAFFKSIRVTPITLQNITIDSQASATNELINATINLRVDDVLYNGKHQGPFQLNIQFNNTDKKAFGQLIGDVRELLAQPTISLPYVKKIGRSLLFLAHHQTEVIVKKLAIQVPLFKLQASLNATLKPSSHIAIIGLIKFHLHSLSIYTPQGPVNIKNARITIDNKMISEVLMDQAFDMAIDAISTPAFPSEPGSINLHLVFKNFNMVSYDKMITWQRKAKDARVKNEDAKPFIQNQKHYMLAMFNDNLQVILKNLSIKTPLGSFNMKSHFKLSEYKDINFNSFSDVSRRTIFTVKGYIDKNLLFKTLEIGELGYLNYLIRRSPKSAQHELKGDSEKDRKQFIDNKVTARINTYVGMNILIPSGKKYLFEFNYLNGQSYFGPISSPIKNPHREQ